MALSCYACNRGATEPRVRVIDLARHFDRAEKRPLHGDFRLAQHTLGNITRATVAVPVPSRVIWTTRLPRRASLHVLAAISDPTNTSVVRFRIGISDDRIYEGLAERIVRSTDTRSGWVPLEANLGAYAGPKLSLFYRPDGRAWRLVMSTDRIDGPADVAFWGEPGVDADIDAARRFQRAEKS